MKTFPKATHHLFCFKLIKVDTIFPTFWVLVVMDIMVKLKRKLVPNVIKIF